MQANRAAESGEATRDAQASLMRGAAGIQGAQQSLEEARRALRETQDTLRDTQQALRDAQDQQREAQAALQREQQTRGGDRDRFAHRPAQPAQLQPPQRASAEALRTSRKPYGVILLDLDNFKQINE